MPTFELESGLALFSILLLMVGIGIGSRQHKKLVRQLNRELDLKRQLSLQIDDAPLPMLIADAGGTITAANGQLCELFGYRSEQLIGQSIERLIPQRFHSQHGALMRSYFAQPHARPMGRGRDLFGLHKDGHEISIEIGLSAVPSSRGISVIASITDVREKKRSEQQLARTNALLSSIIRSAPFSIIASDRDGIITAISPAGERLVGYSAAELVGRCTPAILHDSAEVANRALELTAELGETVEPGFEVFVAKAQRGVVEEREWHYIRKDGSRVPVSLTVTALRDQTDQIQGFLGVAYDISERKRNDDYMRYLAHHDALTGLPNRALLNDRMAMALERSQRFGKSVGLMLIDLDKFKQVNDSLGHHAGDLLLTAVAERIDKCRRATDTVARLGGDEFVVVLPDIQTAADVEPIAKKIIDAVKQPLSIGDRTLEQSLSIGISLYPQHGDDIKTLMEAADSAMYAAKAAGRGTVQLYDDSVADQKNDLGAKPR
ncbi:MAG TPA: diguanylate cyclase [Spongiibacteraceae bacterium]|nr:diguanylate cyclase [Spongiibacteraceae bacterium]